MHLGTGELILILVIILVIFGAGKLPQVMKSLGEGVSSFRKASQDNQKDDKNNSLLASNSADNNSQESEK